MKNLQQRAGPWPLDLPGRLYDWLDHAWEAPRTQRRAGLLLVVAFLLALLLIELTRLGLLGTAGWLPRSHFAAVSLVFTFLLLFEILSLIFSLARSVADAVGKQFELLSLILLRKAFLEFAHVGEPVAWDTAAPVIPAILADMGGALLIFVVVGIYYRIQQHRPVVMTEADTRQFIAAKKAVALLLLAAFGLLGAYELAAGPLEQSVTRFLEIFYTVLILSDILLVLVTLCFTTRYPIVFRNSGFAAATLMLRLALTAPRYINVLLGVGAAVFVVALSLAYNSFMAGPPTAERPAER